MKKNVDSSMFHIVDSPLGDEPPARRSFLAVVGAAVVGGIVAAFPFIAGWGVFFHPLRRRTPGAEGDELRFVRVGPIDLVPADGVPHQFPLSVDVTDAWTRRPAQRVGTVFLTRTDSPAGPKITALSSVCPHLGCAVDYIAKEGQFECPCHASAFAKDGEKLFGPSLRGLDPLPVKLVEANEQQEIWVAFERFRPGIAERVPVG